MPRRRTASSATVSSPPPSPSTTPNVADELTLPQFGRSRQDHAWTSEADAEYSKRLTRDLGVSVGGSYLDQSHNAGGNSGFDNVELSAKYAFYRSAEHETILSAGVDWDVGHTGSADIGAEDFSTVTPTVFFGKGFGDVPSDALKPFAITGTLGYGFPTARHSDGDTNPDALVYGITLQYSIPYLQQHVKDMGWGAPFNRLTPIVESSFTTPIAHTPGHGTTGSIYPGVIWSGQSMQLGLEAQLPVNSASGDGIGYLAQLHFYLDDIFPTSIGRPIW